MQKNGTISKDTRHFTAGVRDKLRSCSKNTEIYLTTVKGLNQILEYSK